jgi:hypothetical protein
MLKAFEFATNWIFNTTGRIRDTIGVPAPFTPFRVPSKLVRLRTDLPWRGAWGLELTAKRFHPCPRLCPARTPLPRRSAVIADKIERILDYGYCLSN